MLLQFGEHFCSVSCMVTQVRHNYYSTIMRKVLSAWYKSFKLLNVIPTSVSFFQVCLSCPRSVALCSTATQTSAARASAALSSQASHYALVAVAGAVVFAGDLVGVAAAGVGDLLGTVVVAAAAVVVRDVVGVMDSCVILISFFSTHASTTPRELQKSQ